MAIMNQVKHIVARITYGILRLKKRNNERILLVFDYIGDACYALSFLDVLREEHPSDTITVVSSEKNKDLISSYKSIDNCVFLKYNTFKYRLFRCVLSDQYCQRMGSKDGIYCTVPWHIQSFRNNDGDGVRKLLARDIYKTTNLEKITFHSLINHRVVSIDRFEAIKNRVVVINQYSTSTVHSDSLFEFFAEKLRSRGYIVYSNVVNDQKPIAGTQELRCELPELYQIAKEIPLIVSIRSGVVDYLINTGVRLFVVYDLSNDLSKFMYNHYSLSEWHPISPYREVALKDASDVKCVEDEFLDFINKELTSIAICPNKNY